MSCFLDLGFTQACVATWFANAANTFRECLDVCLPYLESGDLPNRPPPDCELAECIQCDEDRSGLIFA